MATEAHSAQGKDPAEVTIHIDKAMFKVPAGSMTGAQLRALTSPPIDDTRDLYLDVSGPGADQMIPDGEAVELKPGMHFFTATRNITPGCAA